MCSCVNFEDWWMAGVVFFCELENVGNIGMPDNERSVSPPGHKFR